VIGQRNEKNDDDHHGADEDNKENGSLNGSCCASGDDWNGDQNGSNPCCLECYDGGVLGGKEDFDSSCCRMVHGSGHDKIVHLYRMSEIGMG